MCTGICKMSVVCLDFFWEGGGLSPCVLQLSSSLT